MLRKIVNMLMGPQEGTDAAASTYFEALLESVREEVLSQLAKPTNDPLEVLAQALMRKVVGKGEEVNPQAARAFFSVLAENDRLPLGEQLNITEIELLQHLLVEYFSGMESVRARANEVLGLIERKFSQGAFTQARILLQIFETDAETRLNNERNLFYEDMIMRLGVRRRHEVPEEERDDLQGRFFEIMADEDAEVRNALKTMADDYYVTFCLSLRDPAQTDKWQPVLDAVNADARTRLANYIPPKRWRHPSTLPHCMLLDMTRAHLEDDAPKRHIQRMLRMCYFLLLASGDTGFEHFIYSFLDWSRDKLGVEGKSVLPIIHRRSVLDEVSLQETLDDVWNEHYAEKMKTFVDRTDNGLQSAWNGLLSRFSMLDINEIPPGHYDLGGFLIDELLGFRQPSTYFGFKLFRLT